MRFNACLACGALWALATSFATPQPPLQNVTIANCWQDLAEEDAAKAYLATWTLVRSPAEAVKLLRQHLSPAPAPDLEKIKTWLAELGNSKFAVRDAAFKALELQGEVAEQELRKALDNAGELETRQRIELLLGRLQVATLSPDKRRMVRALEVLELIASPDATELLQDLAKGFSQHRLTREAQETLGRLQERTPAGVQLGAAPQAGGGSTIDGSLPMGAQFRLGTTLFRQQDSTGVRRLAFSSDSLVIASAGQKNVYLWETQTGKVLGKQDYAAACLAFAPKGRILALGLAGSKQKESVLVLWDAGEGKEVGRVVVAGEGSPAQLFFTADGSQIVCKTNDQLKRTGDLRFFDAKSLQEIKQWKPDDKGTLLASAPDGKHVVFEPPQGSAVLWDLQTNTKLAFYRFTSTPMDVVFSADANLLAATGYFGTGLRIWDVANGKPKWVHVSGEPAYYQPILFSPDGKFFAATIANQGGITLWNPESGAFLRDLPDAVGFYAGAISPNSRWLAGSWGKTVRVWDLETGQAVSDGDGHVGEIDRIAFLPPLNAIATASSDGVFRLWDAATGKQNQMLDATAGRRVPGAAFSLDGKRLATSDMEKGVNVWEVATGRKMYQFPGHGRSGAIKRVVYITPDGRYLLSWSPNDFYLRKWDLQNGKAIVEHRIRPQGMQVPENDDENDDLQIGVAIKTLQLHSTDGAFTIRGDQLVLVSPQGKVHFFDVATGKESRVVRVGVGDKQGSGVYLALSPTRKHFALVTRGLQVTVYDWVSGKVVFSLSFPGPTGKVTISPDGRTLATIVGGKVTFVEMATGKTRLTLDLPGNAGLLSFSPDGRRFATAIEDTTALVWDFAALAGRQ